MTTMLEHALTLAKKGFHVFPLIPGDKRPQIKDYPNEASFETRKISAWWKRWPYANVGISTTRYWDTQALLVVDIDNKNGKDGDGSIFELELQGREFPPTLEQRTPTGGKHLIYRVPRAVKQGADVLGAGVDIRSYGGFIVGAGSVIGERHYVVLEREIRDAPDWLVAACGVPGSRDDLSHSPVAGINDERAVERAIHYLENEAPLAVEGQAGDLTTFKVAARLKDIGVKAGDALDLMGSYWNDRCSPPWGAEELWRKIENAYHYSNDRGGNAAPETIFGPADPVDADEDQAPISPTVEKHAEHPIRELNREYAFVVAGGGSHILWETKDAKGAFRLEHLGIPSFHQKLASQMLQLGDGERVSLTKLWMSSPARRSYDGICFMPGKQAPAAFYNLWRGFAVEPSPPGGTTTIEAAKALEDFLAHALQNVCNGNADLFMWLMGFFAHLVQRPWEKPLVALVFRGRKGVGKNALVERVGHLLGRHTIVATEERYLLGNFNSHMERCLLFVLDEAVWAGDKRAEGKLKGLITGTEHLIEHKGKEPYVVDNCTRVVLIGNEEWLVPASEDERRFAVFDVGDGRKQDRGFFQSMREGMERGGYRLLLRYLLDFDLSKTDVNAAPMTTGLFDQKVNSLEPFYQWWFDCLVEGRILNSSFSSEWPTDMDKELFRNAFHTYVKERQMRGWVPGNRSVGKFLKICLPSVDANQKRREGPDLVNVYRFPPLEKARKEWETYIGHEVRWE